MRPTWNPTGPAGYRGSRGGGASAPANRTRCGPPGALPARRVRGLLAGGGPDPRRVRDDSPSEGELAARGSDRAHGGRGSEGTRACAVGRPSGEAHGEDDRGAAADGGGSAPPRPSRQGPDQEPGDVEAIGAFGIL